MLKDDESPTFASRKIMLALEEKWGMIWYDECNQQLLGNRIEHCFSPTYGIPSANRFFFSRAANGTEAPGMMELPNIHEHVISVILFQCGLSIVKRDFHCGCPVIESWEFPEAAGNFSVAYCNLEAARTAIWYHPVSSFKFVKHRNSTSSIYL